MNVFLGKSSIGRNNFILEASGRVALRSGNWLMIPPYDAVIEENVNIELGNSKEFKLYNLIDDIGQKTNLTLDNTAKLEELVRVFKFLKENNNIIK